MGAVNVIVAMGAAKAVRAPFRQEWFNHMLDLPTQLIDHMLDNVITLDQEPSGFDLAWGMPIADVPRQTGEVWPSNGGKLLCLRFVCYEAPIREAQVHAMLKADRFFEIHEEVRAAIAREPFPAQETAIIIQRACHRMRGKRNWPGMDGMCDWQ